MLTKKSGDSIHLYFGEVRVGGVHLNTMKSIGEGKEKTYAGIFILNDKTVFGETAEEAAAKVEQEAKQWLQYAKLIERE